MYLLQVILIGSIIFATLYGIIVANSIIVDFMHKHLSNETIENIKLIVCTIIMILVLGFLGKTILDYIILP